MEAWVGFYGQSVGGGRSENRPKFDRYIHFLAISEAKSCVVHSTIHFLSVFNFLLLVSGPSWGLSRFFIMSRQENGEFHDFLLTSPQKC